MNVSEDLLKDIKEIVNKAKDATEKLEQNWDRDREDFSELKNRVGHLEQEFVTLRELILRIPKRTKESVENAMQPTNKTMENLQGIIEDKEVVAINTQKSKHQPKRWWQFWRI